MNQQKISVIIPVFNGEKFITDAIESVFEQNYSPLELIVVDDGSADRTVEVVQSFNQEIVLISQTNKGVSAARNAGLQRATGDLITFLDADDVWMNNKLVLQTGILEKHPEVDIVFGMLLQIPFTVYKELELIDLNKNKGALATSLGSMLIKKKLFDKPGLFNTEMNMSEDLDWFNRAREAGAKVMVHSDIVQFYRKHDKSLTHNQKSQLFYQLKAYKMAIERKKQQGTATPYPIPEMINFEDVKKQWLLNHQPKKAKNEQAGKSID